MANNNEAKILFKAETSELNDAIQSASSEMSTLRAEMKLNEAQFANTGDQAEYLEQKTKLLESQLEANADKQEALTQKLEAAKRIYGEDSEEVARLERQLINAKTEEEKLKSQLDDTNKGFEEQKDAVGQSGDAVGDMATVLANAGIVDALKEIGEAALDMAQNFDEANATIVEGTGATGDALVDLNVQTQDAFGRIANSGQDLNGMAGILAELNTRFGVTGDGAEDLAVKVQNFAQHTGTDGTRAVDSIANVMKRWNMDLDESDNLLDDLTTANQACQMNVDQLTGYLANNSTQFQELGYSTEEALAMLISLSDGGANVGTVMSGLTKGVANLSAETDDVPGAFRAAIDAISESGSVAEALQQEVGDTGKTVEQVFGKKAAQELATNVLNGSFAVDQWSEALQNNQGILEQTTADATTMQDSWSQAVNNVSIALSQTFAPAISDVVSKVAEVITNVAQVVQDSPALQAVIVGVTTALGILAVALGISSIIQMVTTAWGLLNTVLFASPIFWVVTALAALVAAIVYAYQNCEEFRNIVNAAFEAVKTTATNVFNAVKQTITTVWNNIKTTTSTVINDIKTTVTNVFNAIKDTVTNVWTTIKTNITNLIENVRTAVTEKVNNIKETVSNVFNAVKETATNLWTTIKTNVTNLVENVRTAVTEKVNNIKETVTNVFNAVKETVTNIWNTIKTTITDLIENARSSVSDKVSAIKENVTNVFNAVKETVKSVWDAIKSNIINPIENARNTVNDKIGNLKSNVTDKITSLKSKVQDTFDSIKTKMISPIETAKEKIKGILDKVKGFFPLSIGNVISNLKLPHFSISGGFSLNPPSVPHFSVDWYAKGVIFDAATIIPTLAGLKGVGEAGPEAVSPISVLQDYVGAAVQKYVPQIDYDLMAQKVAGACAKMNISIDVDKRQLGRVVREVV